MDDELTEEQKERARRRTACERVANQTGATVEEVELTYEALARMIDRTMGAFRDVFGRRSEQ